MLFLLLLFGLVLCVCQVGPGEVAVGGYGGLWWGVETTVATTRNAGFSKTHSIKHQLPPPYPLWGLPEQTRSAAPLLRQAPFGPACSSLSTLRALNTKWVFCWLDCRRPPLYQPRPLTPTLAIPAMLSWKECGSLPREIATCCTRFSPVQLGLSHGIDVGYCQSLHRNAQNAPYPRHWEKNKD